MKKKIIMVLAFTSLLISFCFIGESYAKYVTTIDNVASMSVARWRILVNNQDIRNNPEISETLTPTIIENEHIKPGVIAPTSEGYFDLIIDATDVDVSFKYTITPTTPSDSCVKDLKVTSYSINDGEKINIDADAITNNILYSDSERKLNMRIFIKWVDDETQTMDNKADTAITTNASCKGVIKVVTNFIQLQN